MADAADLLYSDALAACEQGRIEDGVAILRRALVLAPDQARIHGLLGRALAHLERNDEALACFDRALAIGPATAGLLGSRADVLVALARRDEAIESYDRALALKPDSVDDWCNRGLALHELGRHDAALASFDRAAAVAPSFAPAHYNRGNVCAALGQHQDAIASYDRAIALTPDHADAHNNRGQCLRRLERYTEALASFDHALTIAPNHLPALINRAGVLDDMRRHEEALLAADSVLAIAADAASVWLLRGNSLVALGRLPDALVSYERAVQHGLPSATAMLGLCSLLACDWPRAERVEAELAALIQNSRAVFTPFALLPFALSPALQRKNAEAFVRHEGLDALPRPSPTRRQPGRKIRLGYVSADFGTHAVTSLIAGLLERHDRARFEVMGISVGMERQDNLRRRVAAACDEFHEFGVLTDADAAGRIHALGIDIAIDLTGYTENARPGILARRPAPIQVSYLGYLGTMGASFMDYIVADAIAVPFDQQPFYAEKIVHLPHCFLVNDDTLELAKRVPGRSEAGLPQGARVLCSFNNSYKYRSQMFDIWMRLLHDFEDCVLWLLAPNETVASNLRQEARNRGVAPDRLVFAPRMDLPDHLARQTLADLFLDTLPYNAGATAAAALWSGVPVLTALGDTMTGRMASSMVRGVGLPELAVANLADYEAKARLLVSNPTMLADIRAKLARNKRTHPLFDTDRSRRHLEAAYLAMMDIAGKGEPPRSFAVPPTDA